MKQLFLLLLLCTPSSPFGTGSLPEPKRIPIDSESELYEAVRRPGILSYTFQITNSSGIFLIMSGIEEVARIAENKRYEMSMRVKVTPQVNLSLALEKCELRSLPIETVYYNEVIVFPPRFINILSDIGRPRCGEVDMPMRLHIIGTINVTGRITINMLEFPSSTEVMIENTFIYYLHLFSYGILLLFVICVALSMFCCIWNGFCSTPERSPVWT